MGPLCVRVRPRRGVAGGDAGQDWGQQNALAAVPGLRGLISAAANVSQDLLEGFTAELPLEMPERGEGARAGRPRSPPPSLQGRHQLRVREALDSIMRNYLIIYPWEKFLSNLWQVSVGLFPRG